MSEPLLNQMLEDHVQIPRSIWEKFKADSENLQKIVSYLKTCHLTPQAKADILKLIGIKL